MDTNLVVPALLRFHIPPYDVITLPRILPLTRDLQLLHEVRPKVQVSRPASMGASRVMGHASIEAPPVKLGALVTHPKFGEGMVTDYEGSGAHARVQVEFADAGSKWLVMAYANLTVI